MADTGKPGNGPATGDAMGQIQARIVAQYIKDVSFENPSIDKMIDGLGEAPEMRLEVNVNSRRVKADFYESSITLSGKASSPKVGTIYELECEYAGLFEIKQIAPQMLEPFLLINCPAMIFPYLRRLVADLTREGGFPALSLDPLDFASLYLRRQQEQAAAQGGKLA